MDIVRRLGSILLKPKEEWVRIKAEKTTVPKLFSSYIMIMAAIPPVFEFLRRILIERVPLSGHWPIHRALGPAALAFAVNLVSVSLLALIIDLLARSFSSTRNMTSALKLAGYSMTPVWVAGIFNIFSGFWVPNVIAILYGLYLLYLGFEVAMMDTPKERALGYMILSGTAAAVLALAGWVFKVILAVR